MRRRLHEYWEQNGKINVDFRVNTNVLYAGVVEPFLQDDEEGVTYSDVIGVDYDNYYCFCAGYNSEGEREMKIALIVKDSGMNEYDYDYEYPCYPDGDCVVIDCVISVDDSESYLKREIYSMLKQFCKYVDYYNGTIAESYQRKTNRTNNRRRFR